jgi:hypothetical protein
MPGSTDNLFRGGAGQRAVMAELLIQKCNVAIPAIDDGDDLFVFRQGRAEVARLQVKTCTKPTLYMNKPGHSAKFKLPIRQLRAPDEPPLYYVLAVRLPAGWNDYLVVSRSDVQRYLNDAAKFGTEDAKELQITVQFRPDEVTCSKIDLTEYRNAWAQLPPLRKQIAPGEFQTTPELA